MVLFHRQDLSEQRLLELITLIHVGAGAQLPDQLHQGLLGSAVPRVVQHLLERVQVVVEFHMASVTDPTGIRERFGASRGGEVGFPPLRWWVLGGAVLVLAVAAGASSAGGAAWP